MDGSGSLYNLLHESEKRSSETVLKWLKSTRRWHSNSVGIFNHTGGNSDYVNSIVTDNQVFSFPCLLCHQLTQPAMPSVDTAWQEIGSLVSKDVGTLIWTVEGDHSKCHGIQWGWNFDEIRGGSLRITLRMHHYKNELSNIWTRYDISQENEKGYASQMECRNEELDS